MVGQLRVLGIDPGINGACALFLPGDRGVTVEGGIFDIPTVGEGNQREIDYPQLASLIHAVRPTHAAIEIVNAFMPTKIDPDTGEKVTVEFGATSLFRFGGAYYAIHAVVACLGIPRRRVASPTWQAAFGLRGKAHAGSDAARQVVLQRYPAVAQFMKLKKHQHRAEALLVGAYSARGIAREEENLDIPD